MTMSNDRDPDDGYGDDDQTVAVSFDGGFGLDTEEGEGSSEAYLTLIAGGTVGEMVRIADEELIIGRSPDAGFRVNDPGASKEHLRICREDNQVVAHDLGSRNGTRVNGRRVTDRHKLEHWDLIEVGDTAIRFAVVENAIDPG